MVKHRDLDLELLHNYFVIINYYIPIVAFFLGGSTQLDEAAVAEATKEKKREKNRRNMRRKKQRRQI